MQLDKVIPLLLEKACPSIQYRLRLELFDQDPTDSEMIKIQSQILQDPMVQEVMNWQQPDGWLAWSFHSSPGTEPGIRLLCEKGVTATQPILAAALAAVEAKTDRLDRGIGKVGKALDDLELGGSKMIQAALLAHAGIENKSLVKEQIDTALEGFRALLAVHQIEEVADPYKGKWVFKQGAKWPSLYHLRLLAFTNNWRTPQNNTMVGDAVQRLVDLSPIPDIYARSKSQLIAPASVFMHDFRPDMDTMDAKTWMMWFHRVELLARAGMVRLVPEIARQVDVLHDVLNAQDGWFTRDLNHPYFKKWNAYLGLMLEKDWKSPTRRLFDLTFRSILILNYSNQ